MYKYCRRSIKTAVSESFSCTTTKYMTVIRLHAEGLIRLIDFVFTDNNRVTLGNFLGPMHYLISYSIKKRWMDAAIITHQISVSVKEPDSHLRTLWYLQIATFEDGEQAFSAQCIACKGCVYVSSTDEVRLIIYAHRC